MPADQEKGPLDADAAVERLNAVLRAQYRSVLGYTLAAGAAAAPAGVEVHKQEQVDALVRAQRGS